MDTIELEPKHIPVAGSADVVVAGGGPAGVCAAIAAAEAGADTLLIEEAGCLGGVWTSGDSRRGRQAVRNAAGPDRQDVAAARRT